MKKYKVINRYTRHCYTFTDTPKGRFDHHGRILARWNETFEDMIRLGETRNIEPDLEFRIEED